MNKNTDFDRIAQTWLQEGPTAIPDRALQAALDEVHATRQRRFGAAWRTFHMNSNLLRFATAALAAVLVVGAAVFYLGNFAPSGTVGGTPSVPPTPTATPVLQMTKTFTSVNNGYVVRYPADWTVEPATSLWWPPAWKGSDDLTGFDFIRAPLDGGFGYVSAYRGYFRAASAVVPEGVAIDDWIDDFVIRALIYGCNRPRAELDEISIDGQPARIRDGCNHEVEATVVVGRRAYIFNISPEMKDRRAIFDAFAATIDLRPEGAPGAPTPTPSPS